jgi:hypothetical protein
MTRFIIIALFTTFPALAQIDPPPKPPLTDREQVKADRAKSAEDDKKAPTTRPWDRMPTATNLGNESRKSGKAHPGRRASRYRPCRIARLRRAA